MAARNLQLTDLSILVVDDQLPMRKIVRTVLQGMGIRSVVEADDGVSALDVLRRRNQSVLKVSDLSTAELPERPVDLVVLDWSMPRMDGLTLLKTLRNTDAFMRLPVMMLTAENDHSQIVAAVEAGVNDYVVKPFSTSTLEAKLRQLIQKIP